MEQAMSNKVRIVGIPEVKQPTFSQTVNGDLFRFPKGKEGVVYMAIVATWPLELKRAAVNLRTGICYQMQEDKEIEILPRDAVVELRAD